jgi:hypothetical protein
MLVHNTWSDFWVWVVGPLAGATVAALLYELLYLKPPSPEVVGTPGSGLDEPRPGETALT